MLRGVRSRHGGARVITVPGTTRLSTNRASTHSNTDAIQNGLRLARPYQRKLSLSPERDVPTRELDPWAASHTTPAGRPAARGTLSPDSRSVLVFEPNGSKRRWVDEELEGTHLHVEVANAAADVVARLKALDAPGIAIVDFDALGAVHLEQLKAIRDAGWSGVFVSLGTIPWQLRQSLRVRFVFAAPYGSERLRKALGDLTTSDGVPERRSDPRIYSS
jgi:CheY-like chemotaxis protein